jgi:hypothetical protein
VLAPTFYWPQFLKPKLEKLLRKKVSSNKRVTPDDTNVVVSVTDRSERDLTRRFDETEIGWPDIEKQLVTWGELFRAGKKLRVDLSFNYLETGQQPTTRKGDKRSFTSATQQMLGERAMQIDAEEESSGQPSTWREVYNLMRCPGPRVAEKGTCDPGQTRPVGLPLHSHHPRLLNTHTTYYHLPFSADYY